MKKTMHEPSQDNRETVPQSGKLLRYIQFPPIRMVIAVVFVGGALVFAGTLQNALIVFFEIPQTIIEAPAALVMLAMFSVLIAHLTYSAYVILIERRSVNELSFSGFGKELGGGMLVGALLFSIVIALLWGLGYYRVTAMNPVGVVLPVLALSIIAGYIEEMFIRGIVFRILEEGLGSWIALIISALLFGLLHLGNPHATLLSSLAISLEAGILLAAAFMFTRRLWFAIGIHFAWNFTQGGIFGVAVSGISLSGILESQLVGPDIITGGRFGAEASVFAIAVCLTASVFLLVHVHRRAGFAEPFWRKEPEQGRLADSPHDV